MKANMVITHYGSRVEPGDVFVHMYHFVRLVYADTAQVTLRTNPFVTHPDMDNHYVRLSAHEAQEHYGLRVHLQPEG